MSCASHATLLPPLSPWLCSVRTAMSQPRPPRPDRPRGAPGSCPPRLPPLARPSARSRRVASSISAAAAARSCILRTTRASPIPRCAAAARRASAACAASSLCAAATACVLVLALLWPTPMPCEATTEVTPPGLRAVSPWPCCSDDASDPRAASRADLLGASAASPPPQPRDAHLLGQDGLPHLPARQGQHPSLDPWHLAALAALSPAHVLTAALVQAPPHRRHAQAPRWPHSPCLVKKQRTLSPAR